MWLINLIRAKLLYRKITALKDEIETRTLAVEAALFNLETVSNSVIYSGKLSIKEAIEVKEKTLVEVDRAKRMLEQYFINKHNQIIELSTRVSRRSLK